MLWRLIRETAGQDIFDLCYSYSSEELGYLRRLSREELPRKGLLIRLASFAAHLLWSLVAPKRRGSSRDGVLVFFFTSRNQRESLVPVARHLPNALHLSLHLRPGARLEAHEELPLARAYLASLPFLPLLVRELWRARGYRRASFSFWLDEYWLSYGFFLSTRLWLRKERPRGVVVSNDHTGLPRTFTMAARAEGIPTFYLQHGAGSTRNPPLAFDFALLDGRDSLEKFQAAGPSQTRVFLVGKPKSDESFSQINGRSRARSIGICTNYGDPLPRLEELCRGLRRRFPELSFRIRPHPRDRRPLWRDLSQRLDMPLSDAGEESSFEFLQAVDVVIAGDSSIHVEAALMNVHPLFFDYSREGTDTHDFQEVGLVEILSEVEDICERVRRLTEEKPDVRRKARRFVATVGSSYDGRSGELAAGLMEILTMGLPGVGDGRDAPEGWRRVSGVGLEAYELAEEGSDSTP